MVWGPKTQKHTVKASSRCLLHGFGAKNTRGLDGCRDRGVRRRRGWRAGGAGGPEGPEGSKFGGAGKMGWRGWRAGLVSNRTAPLTAIPSSVAGGCVWRVYPALLVRKSSSRAHASPCSLQRIWSLPTTCGGMALGFWSCSACARVSGSDFGHGSGLKVSIGGRPKSSSPLEQRCCASCTPVFFGDADVALDALLAWEAAAAPTSYLSMSSGISHNCALLHHQGLVKCWGFGGSGRLGYGSQAFAPGQAPNEMGAALPAVELSQPEHFVRATQIACGDRHSCAVLETGDLKCWGDNHNGQVGQGHDSGHDEFVGDEPFEMGVFLPAIDLGGVNVLQVAPGEDHTCALLQGGVVKCFGKGDMLGLGDACGPRRA